MLRVQRLQLTTPRRPVQKRTLMPGTKRRLQSHQPFDKHRFDSDKEYAKRILDVIDCLLKIYNAIYCWCGTPDKRCIYPRFEKKSTLCKIHLQTNPLTGKKIGQKRFGGAVRTRKENIKCDWGSPIEFPGEWCSVHQPCLCSVSCGAPSECNCENDASLLVSTTDRFGLNNPSSRAKDTCTECGRYRYLQCPVSRRIRNRQIGRSNQLQLQTPISISVTDKPPEEFISLCPR
jgi:hypothetical protein